MGRPATGDMVIHLGLDDAGVQTSLKELKRNIANSTREWKAQEAQLRSVGDISGAVKVKLEGLAKVNELQKQRQAQLNESIKDTSKSSKNYTERIGQATSELSKSSYQIVKNEAQIKSLEQAQMRYSTGIEEVTKKHKAFQGSLDSEVDMLKNQGKELEANEAKQKGLKTTIANLSDEYSREQEVLTKLKAKYGDDSEAIDNQKTRVNKLGSALAKARAEEHKFATGIDELKSSLQNSKSVTESYANLLKAQGKSASSSIVKLNGLRVAYKGLNAQYAIEVQELKRVKSISGTASDAYANQATKVHKLGAEIVRTSDDIKKLNSSVGRSSSGSLNMADSISSLSKKYENVGESAQRAGDKMVGLGTPIAAVAGAGVKLAGDLQHTVNTTKNLIVNSNTETMGEIKKNMKTASSDIQDLSVKYGYSQQQLTEGFQELIKRGYTSSQALGAQKSLLQAAAASGDSYTDVVHGATTAIESFEMRGKTTNEMIHNTKVAVNQMAYAADLSATDFHSMSKAMEYVGTSAHQSGFSLHETAAAIGVLSNSGIWKLSSQLEIVA